MNLADLIRRFRVMANDKAQPYLVDDDDVADWLNDAQAQACIRGRLLREDALDAVCRIALTAGQHTYTLHPSAYELIALWIESADGRRQVTLKSREWLQANVHDWRSLDRPACMAIQDDTTIRLVGTVATGETLVMECYRLPLRPMRDEFDKPEIHGAHHEHLIQWALHKAFSVPDSELFDPNRAAMSERDFTSYFGRLPDSDMRRITREDVSHHNEAILP